MAREITQTSSDREVFSEKKEKVSERVFQELP